VRVLCGNVKVSNSSFVGANAVIKQRVSIGRNITIGAGAVVIKDVPDNITVVVCRLNSISVNQPSFPNFATQKFYIL
jgi:serine acetyltransferase